MPNDPSAAVPPEIAEYQNLVLSKAAAEVNHIRRRVSQGRDVDDGDIADALEAILDLVAPHWRGL